MSALPQPKLPVELLSRSQSARYRNAPSERPNPTSPTVRLIEKQPPKLQLLVKLQQASFGFALISMASSVGLYLATVSIPQLWSQEYQHLERLQRQERQLTEINETLKYQMARQAKGEDSQMSTLEPDGAVFVAPAEVDVNPQPASSKRDRRKEIAFKYAAPGY